MKNAFLSLTCALLLIGSGCAHYHKVEGKQATPEAPNGVKVAIGAQEVKEGEKLVVYKSRCKTITKAGKSGGTFKKCEDQEVGFATVVKVLDGESALVEPLNNLVLDESMKVEKQK